MKYRRIIAILLALCTLLSMQPITATAANMTASEDLIQFIKDSEGFTKYPHWDYQHYSVGYGTMCNAGEYSGGITEAEADALLRRYIGDAEKSVNSFVSKNKLDPSQQEFDCMVSINYGLGTKWQSSSYDLPKLFITGCTELELLNCLGGWVTANGETLNGLIYRRMRENYIYFHGIYNATDNIARDVPYACVKFDPNGGEVDYKRVYTFRGEAYGLELKLPTPIREGYSFAGWFDSKGNRVTDATVAETALMTVTAKWSTAPELYSDVKPTDWFYQDVKRASELGLFTGYSDGSFLPQATMTRAMFAQVLYRIAGEPKCEAALPFTDVEEKVWYTKAVRWAYDAGIVNGVSDMSFAPNRKITREQMATMLYKYAAACGIADDDPPALPESFSDRAEVSRYAAGPMGWAVSVGLINGVGGSRLAPKSDATRAQAAAILVRMTALLEEAEKEAPTEKPEPLEAEGVLEAAEEVVMPEPISTFSVGVA